MPHDIRDAKFAKGDPSTDFSQWDNILTREKSGLKLPNSLVVHNYVKVQGRLLIRLNIQLIYLFSKSFDNKF